jgi:PAS domain S-box-containing protein
MKNENKTKVQLLSELAGLRQQVSKLETLAAKQKETYKALCESEELHRITLGSISDAVFLADDGGALTFICPNVYVIFGYSFDEVQRFGNITKLLGKELFRLDYLRVVGEIKNIERDITDKSKQVHSLLINVKSVSIKDGTILYTCRDITARKKAEAALQKAHNELEEKIKERTVSLEEANIALRVLLHRSDEDKKELGEKVLMNVNDLINPYIEKLGNSNLDHDQRVCLQILKSNLQNIISPFSLRLSSRYNKLTPAEIRVANLVKDGKSTKEIAAFMSLSQRTIDSYRKSIRKKLGIQNEKTNLMTYLLSLH